MKRFAFRLAGIVLAVLPLSAGALAEIAPVAATDANNSAPVRVAQTESGANWDTSRPLTLGDLYRFEERQNMRQNALENRMDRIEERMDRIEERMGHIEGKIDAQAAQMNSRMDTIMTMLVSTLVALVAALLGLVVVLLPRRLKSSAPAHFSGSVGAAPPASAH